MSAYKKLQIARIKLQGTELSKSGLNKFAGFKYFELGDFLPSIQSIFSEVGLSSSITFTDVMATLLIVDTDAPEQAITFTCPVVTPTMKGVNEIQAMGAMMTYIRRYLYVNALEIVEHDAIDATTGKNDVTQIKSVKHKPTDNSDSFKPDADELVHLNSILDTVVGLDTDYEASNAFLHSQMLDDEEKIWVWDKLPSTIRTGIKKVSQLKAA